MSFISLACSWLLAKRNEPNAVTCRIEMRTQRFLAATASGGRKDAYRLSIRMTSWQAMNYRFATIVPFVPTPLADRIADGRS